MKLDRYELKAGQSFTTFEFLSEGKKGKIIKVVQFQKKVPVVRIDSSLDKYDNIVLFPEKLKKANARLEKSGFPKLQNKKQKR